MRLFEVDQGSAREILAVLQGLANKPGREQPDELPPPAVKSIMNRLSLGISTPDALIALKNKVDPRGDVIKDIKDDGTVVLNTKLAKSNDADQSAKPGAGPDIDQMASHNAKTVYK
jgi:hypothetical protein